MNNNFLIFAGTYEGRVLCEFCSKNNISATVSVATDYGREVISHIKGINIINGRLDKTQIEELIKKNSYNIVIDATHPYATEITKNIKTACENTSCKYIRLKREESSICDDNIIRVANIDEALKILNKNNDNVLITTGSKELLSYSKIKNLDRIFVRVLPTHEALNTCELLGLPMKNIICMQGPFTKELNESLIKQLNCKYIVTKDTGKAGGLDDKTACTKHAKIIVIKRPTNETGESLDNVLKILKNSK